MSDTRVGQTTRLSRLVSLGFWLLLALSLLPVWACRYFPSQDGPAHVQNAVILRDYRAADWPLVREFYTVNTRPDPNWFGHLVLAGLMSFAPQETAEKLLVTGYLLLLPLGAWYALRGLRPSAGPLAVLAIPLAHNVLLHRGFYNFCYSLAVYFFVVGYWLRHRDGFGARSAAVLFLLGLLLYLCHPVSLGMAILTIGFLAPWLTGADLVRARSGTGNAGVGRAFVSRAVVPGAALVLPMVLAALFVRRQGTGIVSAEPPALLWKSLRSLEVLFSFQPPEWGVGTALAGLFAATATGLLVVRLRGRRLGVEDGLLVLAALFTGVYFAAPEGISGGTFLNQRLSLFPFFALLLWFGAAGLSGRHAALVLGAAAVLTVTLLVLHVGSYARVNEAIEEYLSVGPQVQPNSTLLPLCYAQQGLTPDGRGVLAMRCCPLLHTSGYLVGRRRTVDLKNYEANTGYFPLLYRPEVNPYRLIGREEGLEAGLNRVPPRAEFLDYETPQGHKVDYVLVWSLSPLPRDPPDEPTREVLRQLAVGYEPVANSRPHGLAQLYRRKGIRREVGP